MENRSLKIFLACATGAGIGTLIAMEVNHYFWWVGGLVGGFLGYLVYNPKETIAVFITVATTIFGKIIYFPYKDAFEQGATIFVLTSNIVIPFLIYGTLVAATKDFIFMYALMCGMHLMLSIMFGVMIAVDRKRCPSAGFDKGEGIKLFNPFIIYPMVLIGITSLVIKGIRLLPRFFRTFVILIHSEVRLLCGIVATLGAKIGYFSGSAIVGALAGGVIGVIYYKIISEWMLGLKPAS